MCYLGTKIISPRDLESKNLQEDLTALEQWLHKWQMSFNPTTCEFLRIANKKTPLLYSYHITTSLIQEVTSINIWECGLTTNLHGMIVFNIIIITHKAAQVNGILYRNLRQCPPHIKTCYKSMVRPILE